MEQTPLTNSQQEPNVSTPQQEAITLLEGFRARQAPLGPQVSVAYERSVAQTSQCTWVLVREAREKGKRAIVAQYFELIARAMEIELAVLKGVKLPLRYFHLHYEFNQKDGPVWAVKEVVIAQGANLPCNCSWRAVQGADLQTLTEAWQLVHMPLSRLR